MIIPNGTLQYKETDERAYDDNGYPLKQSTTYSDEVPCQAVPLQYDRTALSTTTETPITMARYEILINARDYRLADEIRLHDTTSGHSHELRIISDEYLRAVNQYKLLCH